MPGSIIKNIKNTLCGWDGKILGKTNGSNVGHSHKELMKCLYKSNIEIFQLRQQVDSRNNEVKGLQRELGKYLVEQQEEKTKTGLMDVKEKIDLDDKYKMTPEDLDDKKLAGDLLEAEDGRHTK